MIAVVVVVCGGGVGDGGTLRLIKKSLPSGEINLWSHLKSGLG